MEMDENSSLKVTVTTAKDDKKLSEKNLETESTCEKILSSINEECIKISQGKENGIDETKDKLNDKQSFLNTNGKDKDSIEDLYIDMTEENKINGSNNPIETKESNKSYNSDINNEDSKESSNDSTEKEGDNEVKLKLRSFASLCSDDSPKTGMNGPTGNSFSSEISAVSVGDIVQHGNIVESDESGMMHLKISNVVSGEDCITGLTNEEEKDEIPLQIIESSVESTKDSENKDDRPLTIEVQKGSTNLDEFQDKTDLGEKSENIINIFKSPLIVNTTCVICSKKTKCEFRSVIRKKNNNETLFLCTEICKNKAELNIFKDMKIQKPRLYFERICGTCGNEIIPSSDIAKNLNIFSWQTREFCNKMCLADHIGEVTRSCFGCKKYVNVIYMVKYCVRFGSDVHQFCSNPCLDKYKLTIKVCSFCQQNLLNIDKVTSMTSKKQYCSSKCLKRAQRRDIGQQNYKEVEICTVCNKSTMNKYEYVQNAAPSLLCSDTCLKTFKYVSKVKTVNCCLCARLLNAEDSSNYFFNGKQLRVFCAQSCFSVFVISARKIVSCEYCKVKKYNFDMIYSSSLSTDFYTCSMCCLNYAENLCTTTTPKLGLSSTESHSSTATIPPTTSVASVIPVMKECNMCSIVKAAQFHMVMSDSTLRSFCSYICATKFKDIFGFQVTSGNVKTSQNEGNGTSNIGPLAKISIRPQTNEHSSLSEDKVISKTTTTTTTESSKIKPKLDNTGLATLMQIFNPPMVSNKSTMCFPRNFIKAVQCEMEIETDLSEDSSTKTGSEKRKNRSTVIPLPVPIPVFIPTAEKNYEDLEAKIKEIFSKFSANLVESKKTRLAIEEASDNQIHLADKEKQIIEEENLRLVEAKMDVDDCFNSVQAIQIYNVELDDVEMDLPEEEDSNKLAEEDTNKLADIEADEEDTNKLSDIEADEEDTNKLSDIEADEEDTNKLSDIEADEQDTNKLSGIEEAEEDPNKLSDIEAAEEDANKLSDRETAKEDNSKSSDRETAKEDNSKSSDMETVEENTSKLPDTETAKNDCNKLTDTEIVKVNINKLNKEEKVKEDSNKLDKRKSVHEDDNNLTDEKVSSEEEKSMSNDETDKNKSMELKSSISGEEVADKEKILKKKNSARSPEDMQLETDDKILESAVDVNEGIVI